MSRGFLDPKVQLLGDRLTLRKLEDEGGPIQYIPLDRISMRPRPRGYKPYVGVHLLDARCDPVTCTTIYIMLE